VHASQYILHQRERDRIIIDDQDPRRT